MIATAIIILIESKAPRRVQFANYPHNIEPVWNRRNLGNGGIVRQPASGMNDSRAAVTLPTTPHPAGLLHRSSCGAPRAPHPGPRTPHTAPATRALHPAPTRPAGTYLGLPY
ncbi:unnamed protein product [Colias eurytheme]|nr:unnamed protein product [Colias eurytheme]